MMVAFYAESALHGRCAGGGLDKCRKVKCAGGGGISAES